MVLLSVLQVEPVAVRKELEDVLTEKSVSSDVLEAQALVRFVQSRIKDYINLVDPGVDADDALVKAEEERLVSSMAVGAFSVGRVVMYFV